MIEGPRHYERRCDIARCWHAFRAPTCTHTDSEVRVCQHKRAAYDSFRGTDRERVHVPGAGPPGAPHPPAPHRASSDISHASAAGAPQRGRQAGRGGARMEECRTSSVRTTSVATSECTRPAHRRAHCHRVQRFLCAVLGNRSGTSIVGVACALTRSADSEVDDENAACSAQRQRTCSQPSFFVVCQAVHISGVTDDLVLAAGAQPQLLSSCTRSTPHSLIA